MTDLADRLEALGAKATAGEWEVRDHVVSPPHNLDRVKITPQHGPLGSLDRPDAELIVTLANNRQTFIDALRRVDALKADLDQQAKLKWEAYDANKRQAAEIARLREALSNPPKHKFWGAGEPDCPRELKAGNGELRTLRCKVCGEDNPRDSICRWAIGTRESDSDAAMRFIDKLRADYGTVTILPDNEEADTKAEQMAIDCCGEWTNWQDQRFYGETILQCLAKAVVVQEKARAALETRNV